MIFRYLFLSIILLVCQPSIAQQITGMSTVYDHSFTDWIIFAGREEEGRLEPVYRLGNDWTEWNYRVGERSGYLEQKFEDDPGLWELSGGDEIITMRPVYPRDFRSWRITNDDITLEVYSVYGDYPIQWKVDGRFGTLLIEQVYEGDPRDWIVEDQLHASIPWEMKLSAVCIAILHSIPKF